MTQIVIALFIVAPAVAAAYVATWDRDATYRALGVGAIGFVVLLAGIQRFVPQGQALFPVLLGLLPLAGIAAGALIGLGFQTLRPAAGEGPRAGAAGALVAAATVTFYVTVGLI